MTDVDRFKAAVEKFITDRGLNPTQFGRQYAGDPRFVFDLRDGREPRSSTRTRVLEKISATPQTESAAG